MAAFPLAHIVEVQGPDTVVIDRFEDEHTVPGEWVEMRVAGWFTSRPDESAGDSLLRTSTELTVYCPTKLSPAARLRLPDGSEWEVEGEAENYDHGPFGFVPGLVVIHARKVDG